MVLKPTRPKPAQSWLTERTTDAAVQSPLSARGVTTVAELKTEVAEELQSNSPQGHSVFVKGF